MTWHACQRKHSAPSHRYLLLRRRRRSRQRANDTIYGLAAYLFTTDLSRGIRVAEKLDYGVVGLNDGGPSVAQAPFGGFKQSGIGREGGHEGLEEFLESKYVSLKMWNEFIHTQPVGHHLLCYEMSTGLFI